MNSPITPAALSQIESGKARPTPNTVRELADALRVPVEFFAANWSADGTDDIAHRVTYFRDLAATPSRERRRATAMTLLMSDLVRALETEVQLPRLQLPPYPVVPATTREEIDAIAQAVRGEWDLHEEQAVPNVVAVMEQHGVAVARFRLATDTVSAFSIRSQRPLVMLAANKANYVRSRFDAAHELGHLVMHGDADSNDRSIEAQAHQFASSFLLPMVVAEQLLPRRIDAGTWPLLAGLKRDLGVSISAMLYRSHEMGLLSQDRYRNAMKYMSSRGWRKSEPGDRQMGPAEAPTMVESALRLLSKEQELSPADFIVQAHLPLEDTIELVRATADSRPRLG